MNTGAVAVRENVEGGVEGVFSSPVNDAGSTAAASFLAFLRADLEMVGGSVGGIEVIVEEGFKGGRVERKEGGRRARWG